MFVPRFIRAMAASRISMRMKAMAAAKCRLLATYCPSIASPMRKNLPLPSFCEI